MTKATQRYYWLKLQENFFERDEIKIIEAMPNGKDYILFYLKLMLKSINDSGRLMFKNTIPYTPEMLGTITRTNIDVVRVAVDTFIGLGLMEKLDDGALFMGEVNKMLGTETEFAQKKREYRAEKKMSGLLPDKSKTKKDNVRQEIDIDKEIEKDTPYNPPRVGTDGVWLSCIKGNGYQFTDRQVQAISAWVTYKIEKKETVSLQQIELTLKQLNGYVQANQDIVYLIETSIARGYKGIMEPTKNSIPPVSKPSKRYQSDEYIIPENPAQKIELRDYILRCYMFQKLDPRTNKPLTGEQLQLVKEHFQESKKQHKSFTDYVYQEEILTGICLLEQAIVNNKTNLADYFPKC